MNLNIPSELKTMFEFQFLIHDMQGKIIEARGRGVSEEILSESIKRVDKLIEIYKSFDSFYYNAHFAQQKILQQQSDLLVMAEQIEQLKTENEKLTKSIAWNQ